jgi:hypothetical protein
VSKIDAGDENVRVMPKLDFDTGERGDSKAISFAFHQNPHTLITFVLTFSLPQVKVVGNNKTNKY